MTTAVLIHLPSAVYIAADIALQAIAGIYVGLQVNRFLRRRFPARRKEDAHG